MKIINWIFSSFFRTFGRFLFYIAIGLLAMLFINGKVNAESIPLYIENSDRQLLVAPYARFYTLNGTQATASTTQTSTDYGFYITQDTVTQTGSGELICFDTGSIFYSGVTYQISIYLGSQDDTMYFRGNINYGVPSIGSTLSDAKNYWEDLNYGITKNYNTNTNGTFGLVNKDGMVLYYSNLLLYVLTPSRTGSTLCIPFNGANKTNTNSTIFYGFTYDILGNLNSLTSNDIQNVIQSSGLATATSVDEVSESVAELKTELNNVNSSIEEQTQQQEQNHQETMNTITSTESADLGALENSAGWLPAGPVDSILNLPLSLLNNLTSNLSKSCQPVLLPIPYVNRDLNLPCVNTLYADMGINGWVTTIGVIASAFIMFSYLLKLYKWVDDTLSFRENNQIDNWGGI